MACSWSWVSFCSFAVLAERTLVAADSFHAHAGEDVRGHVQRVRCGGCDVGVAHRGRQPLIGDRRVVVGVDQIMRDPRMVGVLLKLRSRIPAPCIARAKVLSAGGWVETR